MTGRLDHLRNGGRWEVRKEGGKRRMMTERSPSSLPPFFPPMMTERSPGLEPGSPEGTRGTRQRSPGLECRR
jgi:hypothetical protein